jgi:hypothetical protein
MNNLGLPPFPTLGASGPQVCEAVRFYLAIVDELSFEQVRILSEHVKGCEECAAEFQLLQKTTRMLAALPASMPSARVDNAIRAFARNQQARKIVALEPQRAKQTEQKATRTTGKRATSARRRVGTLALVAALLLMFVLAAGFLRGILWPPAGAQSFVLPSNLTWNGYVLHYIQTQEMQGKPYQIEVYQDLGTNQMHIESRMEGEFDIVVVTDQQTMLGEDMMHHVAEQGESVAPWAVDGSTFDLAELRQDLASQRAVYLGQTTFEGQTVYQIRSSNGQILLLNNQYLPINALDKSSSVVPMYSTCELMQTAQVDDSMWDMQVPANFHMGKLPAKS